MFILILCSSVYSTDTANETEITPDKSQQKRELNDKDVGQPSQDQLAQEQNTLPGQQYQIEIQPQYYLQSFKHDHNREGLRTKNLRKIYVAPNKGKTQYATIAPQVQVAPVHENTGEQEQQYQQINQQGFDYFNSLSQQPKEEPAYSQQLFYPNKDNQNYEEISQNSYTQVPTYNNYKYQLVPYEYNLDIHQTHEIQQPQQINVQSQQEDKPFLHIRLLPFYSKSSSVHPLQNSLVTGKYAPLYSAHQESVLSSELLGKYQKSIFQENLQAQAIARWEKYVNQETDHKQESPQNSQTKYENNLKLKTHAQIEPTIKSQEFIPQYQVQNQQTNEILEKIKLAKLQAQAQAEAIAKSPPVIVHKEINILKRKPINIIEHVPIPVPTPVLVPVPQPYEQYIPQPYPVPMEIIRPYIVPVKKTETIEVEKPVPVEVEKIVHVPVEKKVYYKVEKPVPVEKTVHVEVTKEIPVEIPVYKPEKLTILRHVWKD